MPAPANAPQNFPEILERIWWKLDRALDEEILRAGARYYVANSLLAGTTTLIDHHESPNFIEGSLDVLADACQEFGVRAALCYGATERNGGSEEGGRGLDECARFIRDRSSETLRGFFGLHASFTVSDQLLERAASMCRDYNAKMHVHIAEDIADVLDAKERGYDGPLERLLELGALPPGSLAIHGVYLNEDQVRVAHDANLWFVQNPRSNEGNGVGYPGALHASTRVALGTDGYPADMVAEQDALFRIGRENNEPVSVLGHRLGMGQALAAELFDRDSFGLKEGAFADIVIERDGVVQDVMVDGNFVVKGGVLVHADLRRIREEAEEAARSLWKRMAAY